MYLEKPINFKDQNYALALIFINKIALTALFAGMYMWIFISSQPTDIEPFFSFFMTFCYGIWLLILLF
jgi:hypothetical protein